MSAGTVLRLFMIAVGVVFLVMTVLSLTKKHMTESFCIAWGIVSFLIILAGIILQPAQWNRYISWEGMLLACLGMLILLYSAFYFSVSVSRLTREVRELSIQVSLLNQENETRLREFPESRAEGETKTYEEEAPFRN